MMRAKYWHGTGVGRAECDLCPHRCRVMEGKTGLCRVRGVQEGELRALSYGHVSSLQIDPIEKKPLHHFMPGRAILSVGGWGCNLSCVFCQNWSISQQFEPGAETTADAVASQAGDGGSIGVAYTYNEPIVGFEFMLDCARRVRARGLRNVLVTNGYINPEPAAELLPLIDAMNVDLKSLDDAFYRKQCRGSVSPVLEFCRQSVKAGVHVEITNLVVPTMNDDISRVGDLARWVSENLGRGIALHLSAYHPQFKLRVPPTSIETLEGVYEVARRHLDHVYLGNVTTETGQHTVCQGCGETLVTRRGYTVRFPALLPSGACSRCGRPSGIVMG